MTSPSTNRTIGVALLGAGTVGSQVARLLVEHADELASNARSSRNQRPLSAGRTGTRTFPPAW